MHPMKLKPCGTVAAYQRHLTRGETPCTECRNAQRLHIAKWRNHNRTPNTKPPTIRDVCGTYPGYNRHMHYSERTCEPCRWAMRLYKRATRAKKKRQQSRGTWADVIIDYLDTYGDASPTVLHARITDRHPDLTVHVMSSTLRRLVKAGVVVREVFEYPFGGTEVTYRINT